MLGTSYPCTSITPGRILADGEKIRFGSHELEVLHTPGHTRGSVTFYCAEEHVAFTGDTLFRMSIGRTDFAGGSWSDMQKSLKLLAELPGETIVYPGHGGATTIGYEKRYNPYMR
jgi:glyoxylase-like metal-dependent hydrolase (beta-lactamase superfamily II)